MSESTRCPSCGFAYAWDGIRCNHCNPDRYYWGHTEEEAFLERMYAEPDDELIPLVYADWLDDQGDIRGMLLRLEMQRLKVSPNLDREAFIEIETEIRAVLEDADFPTKHWFDDLKSYRQRRAEILMCGMPPTDHVDSIARMKFRCSMTWQMLTVLDNTDARRCRHCERQIHYCTGESQAIERILAGDYVAINSQLKAHLDMQYKPIGRFLYFANATPYKLWTYFIYKGEEPHLVFENDEGVTLEGVLLRQIGGGVDFELRPNPDRPTVTSLPDDLSIPWLRQFHLWLL